MKCTVPFMVEDFGVNGASYDAVESLVANMAATLEASFSSGDFASGISADASKIGVDVLGAMTTVELTSFDITEISYSQSHLVYYYDGDVSVFFCIGSSRMWLFGVGI